MADNASWLAAAQAAGGQVSGQPAAGQTQQTAQPTPQSQPNQDDPWVKAALASGGLIQQPEQSGSAGGVLSGIKNAVAGPTTAVGAPVSPDMQNEASGVSDIFHGNIRQGASKILAAETPHVIAGSLLEKAMKAIDPSFQGTPASQIAQNRTTAAPLIDTGQFIDKNQHPVLKAIAEATSSMTSPENVAIMIGTGGLGLVDSPQALATANKLLSAGFSAQAIGSAYKHLRGFAQAYEKGDANDALYQLTHAVLSGTMSAVAGAHAAGVELPVASETDKAIAGKVAGKVGEIGQSITGAVAGAKQSLAEKMGFGQDFNDLIKNTSEPSKTNNPGYAQKVEAASPFLRDILNKNPDIKTPEDFVSAIYDRQKAVDAQLLDRAKGAQGTAQAQMPGVVDRAMSNLDTFFKNEGAGYKPDEVAAAKAQVRDFMEQQGALTDPDLFNVEKIRQRFNNDTRTVFGQDPGTVPPAVKAAKAATAAFLRPEIDQKYTDLGVDGVKEWRKQEANLIDVRDQLELAQKKSEQMGEFSLLKTAIGNAGWPTVLAALGHGPLGLAAEIGKIAKDYVTDYKTNPNTLISRAKALAGPAGPSGEPAFNQVPPTPKLLPPGPTVTPTRVEPVEPESSEPFIDPTTRAVRLGLLLPEKSVVPEPMNISGVRTEPIEPAGSGPFVTTNFPAELAPVAEQAKAAAEKNGVEFRGIQQGATPDKDVAIFEHPKYGSVGVKVNDWSPEQLKNQISDLADRNKPKTEELPTPKTRFQGVSPESIRTHELGHAIAADLLGAGAESINSHLHPLNVKNRTAASAKLDFSSYGARPDGVMPTSSVVEHLGDLLTIFMSGGVAQELAHGTSLEDNPHMYGDTKNVKSLLRDLQYPEDRIDQHIAAAATRARDLLNTPKVLDAIKEHSAYREPGTDEKYQISPDRLKNILEQVRGVRDEGNNTTSDQERAQRNPGNDAGGKSEGAGSTGQEVTAANITEDDLADRIAARTGDKVEADKRAKGLIAARDGNPKYSGIERRAAPEIIKHYMGPERRMNGQTYLSGEYNAKK